MIACCARHIDDDDDLQEEEPAGEDLVLDTGTITST